MVSCPRGMNEKYERPAAWEAALKCPGQSHPGPDLRYSARWGWQSILWAWHPRSHGHPTGFQALQACTYSHPIRVQLFPEPTQGPIWRVICWG